MALSFSKVHKTEVYDQDGKLQWLFTSYASVDNKPAGCVSASTLEGCVQQVDHWLSNPDEWTSQAMRLGYL